MCFEQLSITHVGMEITLGNFSSPNPDTHARQGSFDPNFNYANVDKSIIKRNVGGQLPGRTAQDGLVRSDGAGEKEDSFELSRDARRMYGADVQNLDGADSDRPAVGEGVEKADRAGLEYQDRNDSAQKTNENDEDSLELSPEAKRMVESLKATDREVRAHEAAHLAAGAGIVNGGAQFTTQRGPDGNMYAIGGEVSIDASPVANDPEATIAKAQRIVAAALAPASPSPQDRSVAANARRMEATAAAELASSSPNDQEGFSPQGRQAISAYGADQQQSSAEATTRAYQTVA